jgi:hypothetical protein
VGDAAMVIGALSESGLAPQDVTVQAVHALCATLSHTFAPELVPWARCFTTKVFLRCVYSLVQCLGVPNYDAAVDTTAAAATRTAARHAALGLGAPSMCLAVAAVCVANGWQGHLYTAGNCLRLLLGHHESVWRELGAGGVQDMLRSALALMRDHAACADLQLWVLRNVLLPSSTDEMMERRTGMAGLDDPHCLGVCCAVHGHGAPRALAALLDAGALPALAAALCMRGSVRTLAGVLLVFLVQNETDARRALLHADADGALMAALATAHDASLADPSDGADESDEDDDIILTSWNPLSAVGAALCLLTLSPDGIAAAVLAKRIAAAARASAELLAEEEAEKAVVQRASAKASKKKGSRARRAARNAASTAGHEHEEDEQEPEQEVDAAVMALALRRTAAGSTAARAPESRAAAAATTASLASLRIRQALPSTSGSAAAAALPCDGAFCAVPPFSGGCHPVCDADEAHEDDELCVCCLDAPRDTPMSGCVCTRRLCAASARRACCRGRRRPARCAARLLRRAPRERACAASRRPVCVVLVCCLAAWLLCVVKPLFLHSSRFVAHRTRTRFTRGAHSYPSWHVVGDGYCAVPALSHLPLTHTLHCAGPSLSFAPAPAGPSPPSQRAAAGVALLVSSSSSFERSWPPLAAPLPSSWPPLQPRALATALAPSLMACARISPLKTSLTAAASSRAVSVAPLSLLSSFTASATSRSYMSDIMDCESGAGAGTGAGEHASQPRDAGEQTKRRCASNTSKQQRSKA